MRYSVQRVKESSVVRLDYVPWSSGHADPLESLETDVLCGSENVLVDAQRVV